MRADLSSFFFLRVVRRIVCAASPWLTLAMVIPALIVFNLAFMNLFPAHPGQKAGLSDVLNPESQLLQSAYIYNTRDPNQLFGNFYYTLGTQLAARGQLTAAETMLDKASHLLADNPFAHMKYGVVLEAVSKNGEALAQYNEAVRLAPKLLQAHYSQGLLLDKMDRTDDGIKSLQKAVELAPDNSLVNYDLGVMYAKKNNYEKSALYSRKAVESGGDFAEAYNNYGYALAQLGQHAAALTQIEKSLALKPDSAAALDSKGYALYGLGRYEEAMQVYTEALKIDPTIGEIYLHIAQAEEKLNRVEKAVKAYETYLQMTPDAPDKAQVEEKIRVLKKWIVAKPVKS